MVNFDWTILLPVAFKNSLFYHFISPDEAKDIAQELWFPIILVLGSFFKIFLSLMHKRLFKKNGGKLDNIKEKCEHAVNFINLSTRAVGSSGVNIIGTGYAIYEVYNAYIKFLEDYPAKCLTEGSSEITCPYSVHHKLMATMVTEIVVKLLLPLLHIIDFLLIMTETDDEAEQKTEVPDLNKSVGSSNLREQLRELYKRKEDEKKKNA